MYSFSSGTSEGWKKKHSSRVQKRDDEDLTSLQNFRRALLVHEPDPKIWVIGTMGGIILIVILGKVHIHRVGKYMIALLSW